MNRLTTTLFAAALLLLGVSPCIGAEAKAVPDYEQLKALEWMIGDWEAEWVIPAEGFPSLEGYVPGAEVHSTSSNFWMQNKNYIGSKGRDVMDGKVLHEVFEMVGVDPKSKKIIHWLFSILGGWGTGEWSFENGTWTLKWSGTTGDGTRLGGVSYITQIDANTYTWEMKQLKRDGKNVPDTPKITNRRVAKKPKSG